jgi:hypothetical protein
MAVFLWALGTFLVAVSTSSPLYVSTKDGPLRCNYGEEPAIRAGYTVVSMICMSALAGLLGMDFIALYRGVTLTQQDTVYGNWTEERFKLST